MNIEELQRIASAATPGPWRALDAEDSFGVAYDGDEVANLCACVVAPPASAKLSRPQKDAKYIATFHPATVTLLLDVVKAAKEASNLRGPLSSVYLDGLRAAIAALEQAP